MTAHDGGWDEIGDLLSAEAEGQDGREVILRRARTEGLKVAYETAMELCREKATPAQARAAMVRTILEIGGVLDFRDREASAVEKQLHEMNGEELEAAVAEVRARMAREEGTRASGRRKRPRGVLD